MKAEREREREGRSVERGSLWDALPPIIDHGGDHLGCRRAGTVRPGNRHAGPLFPHEFRLANEGRRRHLEGNRRVENRVRRHLAVVEVVTLSPETFLQRQVIAVVQILRQRALTPEEMVHLILARN